MWYNNKSFAFKIEFLSLYLSETKEDECEHEELVVFSSLLENINFI